MEKSYGGLQGNGGRKMILTGSIYSLSGEERVNKLYSLLKNAERFDFLTQNGKKTFRLIDRIVDISLNTSSEEICGKVKMK